MSTAKVDPLVLYVDDLVGRVGEHPAYPAVSRHDDGVTVVAYYGDHDEINVVVWQDDTLLLHVVEYSSHVEEHDVDTTNGRHPFGEPQGAFANRVYYAVLTYFRVGAPAKEGGRR